MIVPTYQNPARYRDYIIYQSDAPIASCAFEFVHKDFDGPEEDNRYGHAASVFHAVVEIDERLDS